MKKILLILALSFIALSCKNEKSHEETVAETQEMAINYQSFGDKITDEDVLPNNEIIEYSKASVLSFLCICRLICMVRVNSSHI